MEQEKLYVIEEKTYEVHIDEGVHLYGLLYQLAFLARKIKDHRDMENLIDTARRHGEIADQMFYRWSIPGRYLVFGDKADLARLKAVLAGRLLYRITEERDCICLQDYGRIKKKCEWRVADEQQSC